MIPKTKRFAYRVLLDYYTKLDNNLKTELGVVSYDNGCTTILGVRKVGKTTLLQQLCSYDKAVSVYMDCSGLSEDFDFEVYYEALHNRGIRRVYLDEICKISEDLIADFISTTKYYSSVMLITITGSVPSVVEKLADRIGRGLSIYLPPITYTERLIWGTNQDVEDFLNFDYRGATSYEKLLSYLKYQNTDSGTLDSYVCEVVEDTLNSYLRRTPLEGVELPFKERILQIVNYIALCQYMYKLDSNIFVSIPSLSKSFKTSVEEYNKLKVRYNATNEEIRNVCKLLWVSGLAKSVSSIDMKSISGIRNIELFPLHSVDERVPALIFEYPWIVCRNISMLLSEEVAVVSEWLENAFLLRQSYIYSFVDKYRSENTSEIDTVYCVDSLAERRLCGLEVKNRKSTSVTAKNFNSYDTIRRNLGLDELCISCNDVAHTSKFGFEFYRGDLIMIALELAYFDMCRSSLLSTDYALYAKEPISKLIDKYNLL